MISSSQYRALWTAALGVPLLLAAIAALQARIDGSTRAFNNQADALTLPSSGAVRRLSLGYDALAADIYWTRAVQYYGARAGSLGARYDQLFPLLDIATSLDPKLTVAYRFGAIFLSEPPPVGAGQTGLAIQLVKSGLAANPDNWQLASDLAFLYYWRLHDYPAASQAYFDGSRMTGAPSWMKIMAAIVAQRGGALDTSRLIWTEIYNSTNDKNVRDRALKTLRGLRALEDEQLLDQLAREYQQRFGHFPSSPSDLRDAGLVRGNPVDPQGYAYVFGPDGKSQLNPQSPVEIPQEVRLPGELAH